jgi:hypothetical protein
MTGEPDFAGQAAPEASESFVGTVLPADLQSVVSAGADGS